MGQDEITSKGQGKWYIQEADLAKARYDDKFIDMYSKGDGADPEIEPAEEDPKSDEEPSESHTTSFLVSKLPCSHGDCGSSPYPDPCPYQLTADGGSGGEVGQSVA